MTTLFQLPLVVSYYTKDTPYEREAQKLIRSCEQFGIEYLIEGLDDRGSWESNCAIKPRFLERKMHSLQRSLLWVDADAIFLKPMQFEEFMFADMALSYAPLIKDPRFCVATGTVYVNSTEGGISGLRLWCSYLEEIHRRSGQAVAFADQASLYFVIRSNPSFSCAALPATYLKIFDHPVDNLNSADIVIEHHQASRKWKNRGTAYVD